MVGKGHNRLTRRPVVGGGAGLAAGALLVGHRGQVGA